MKRIKTLFTGLLAFISFTSQAQGNNSLLWRISGNGLAKSSYLFGTMHLICKDDFLWTAPMKQSLNNSEKVCFEMDLDDNNTMMQAAAGLIDNSGKVLKDYFTAEQYELVKRYIKDSTGMDISMMEHMKPVALQTLVSTKSAYCADPVSYEDSIMQMAHKDKKEIIGLELAQEQLDALESIPVDTVIKELLDMIKDNKGNDSEYKAMVQFYKTQDLPGLYNMMVNSKDLQDEMGVFLDERNKKWIPRMTKQMKASSVFYAVGAGHLYGEHGVIALLRKDGYKVEAVKK